MPSSQPPLLNIAIIGGGPAGLGCAIALSSMPNIKVTIYEQARELREIGAGIRIGSNCWKVLDLLGALEGVRGAKKTKNVHRNGLTGEVVKENITLKSPPKHQPIRARRTRVQQALLARIPDGVIKLQKRLRGLEKLDNGKTRLSFEDGTEENLDLVVGADGIRSVVRNYVFPDHSIKFTGTTIFRTLVPLKFINDIPDFVPHTTWWHGPAGHFQGSLVDDETEMPEDEQMFEMAARIEVDPATANGKKLSWGIPATNEKVNVIFTDFDPRVREALSLVPEGNWKEFSTFAGPRLEKVIAWEGRVVLIGDASHPLSGAFGSGAAFALEDGWILAKCIEYTRDAGGALRDASELADRIRSPYYLRMYQHLDAQKARIAAARAANPKPTFETRLAAKVNAFGGEETLSWIYGNDIEKVWNEFLAQEPATPQNGVKKYT